LRVIAKGAVSRDPSKKLDGLKEGEPLEAHDEIDGIEVLAAAEAASEVGARVCCGVELAADRTEEAEVAVATFPRDSQTPNELGDVDVVSKSAQFRFRYPSRHEEPPQALARRFFERRLLERSSKSSR
jgi:hypothetical protein